MTTSITASRFTDPASERSLERTAAALTEGGFAVEILDDAAAARARVKELIPEGAVVLTGASETLRLSGIDEDLNESGRYDSVRARAHDFDRATQRNEIWRALSVPDVIIGSVAAVTETGSMVIASASGSQLPGFAGAAPSAIWIIGAQKVVPDLDTAFHRLEDHCLPLENERAMQAYGVPSAPNRVLILNAEHEQGRGTVLLLREAIGF
ncbi:LUD domain-containing protein [Streptomyces sp. HPF1205]|uniref:LUD domain-containing protein n=1 Tax=Streptomyces sp. HPF1205 TaxID=2873262 RepID=UPI001CEDA86B|nr:LUD domain-containing protein [Streptomyces sp. HPF1205]